MFHIKVCRLGFVPQPHRCQFKDLLCVFDELHTIWKGASCRTQNDKAALKLQIRFDVLTGTFQHFQLTAGITAGTKAEAHFQPLPEGSGRLADLSYFSLDEFERLTQSGVFWITQLKAGCPIFDAQQEPFCLQKRLASQTLDTINLSCFIGASKRLPAHLVAGWISEAEANKCRRYIRHDAKRRGKILQNNASNSQDGISIVNFEIIGTL